MTVRSFDSTLNRAARGRCVATLLLPGVLLAGGCASRTITADLAYFPLPPSTAHAVHLKSFNALDEIVPQPGRWTDIFGGGPVGAFVSRPGGVAFRGDHLYIADLGSGIVHDWNLSTGKARRLGASRLDKPVAVAVDDSGSVYVADTQRAAVVVLAPDGGERAIKPPREAYRPVAVAVDRGRLFVADTASHQVDAFAVADGSVQQTIGGVGSEPGKFYFPTGVAVDAQGRLFTADMMNARVQGFDPAYQPFVAMGQPGNRYGDMGKPRNIAVGPDGVVFVADPEFGVVHLFDQEGRLLILLDDARAEKLRMPIGVAIAEALPPTITRLVPADFEAHYYLFVTHGAGEQRISLYAIGLGR